jgi:hypothetical protein
VISHHCPKKAVEQGSWLSSIGKALSSGSEDFAFWIAVHWQDLCEKESDLQVVRSTVCDLRDWVRACVVQSLGTANIESICHMLNDKDVVDGIQKWLQTTVDYAEAGKPFNKEMSLQTVFKLSDEWHDRQAAKEAADVEFPQEWYEGGTVGDFRIEPVRTSAELSQYAYRFHNCVTSYARQVADESCFIYIVFEGDEPKAMLEIENRIDGVGVSQIKGPRNSEVSPELRTAVSTWWDTRKRPAN